MTVYERADRIGGLPTLVLGSGLQGLALAAFMFVDGLVDGLTIELVSGEIATVNFISGNTFIDAVPVATGPIPCGTPVTLTFNLTTDDYTPDVFGYNAVVRATGEVTGDIGGGDLVHLKPIARDPRRHRREAGA